MKKPEALEHMSTTLSNAEAFCPDELEPVFAREAGSNGFEPTWSVHKSCIISFCFMSQCQEKQASIPAHTNSKSVAENWNLWARKDQLHHRLYSKPSMDSCLMIRGIELRLFKASRKGWFDTGFAHLSSQQACRVSQSPPPRD